MSFKLPWVISKPANKHDVSLDDILPSKIQRIHLILLVVLCTDAMRESFTCIFGKIESDPRPETGDKQSILPETLPGLEQAGIIALNNWRAKVLKKMGEALSIQPDVIKRAKADYNVTMQTEVKRDWVQQHAEDIDSEENAPSNSLQSNTLISRGQPRKIQTPLSKLEDEKRALILNSCLFILVSLEDYSAYSRVLLHHVCYCLELHTDVLRSSESTLALTLLKSASSTDMDTDDICLKHAEENAWSRRWKVGLATVAGATLVGVTGGLAAPIVLGAAGAIMGGVGLGGLATLLGATIANPITIAALFGAFGGRMTGKAMDKYTKEVKEFRFIPISKNDREDKLASTDPASSDQKLRVIIGVSGWLVKDTDVVDPWRVFSDDALELFALQYEREALMEFGSIFMRFLRDSAYSFVQAGAIGIALPAVSVAMAPLSLLQFGRLLDNPFTVAMERSDKAGKVLAAALINKVQGERPVTLVGYSLGARVIFTCLQELADKEAFGLVESVVLAGAPVPSQSEEWKRIRAIVVGRVVNVYSTTDYLLSFLYRTRNAQLRVAGLEPVIGVSGVENKDVTRFVTGHQQYQLAIGRILSEANFEDLDSTEVDRSEIALNAEIQEEKEIHRKAKEAGKLHDQEDEEGHIVLADASDFERSASTFDKTSRSDNSVNRTEIAELEALSQEDKISSKPQDVGSAGVHAGESHVDEHNSEDKDVKKSLEMLDLDPEPESEVELVPSIVVRRARKSRVPVIYESERQG